MTSEGDFPIVGIGASAGGLEALEGLFGGVPGDIGMAFVLVTHMARGQQSALAEILARFTPLDVATARNGAAIRPNHIYVCPPDSVLTVEGGRIRLHPRASESQHKPIDVFLSSLAEDHGEASIGIVLSGGGSDGALGIKGIKERGGFTLAQGPDGRGPQQTGMPDTAIASGVIDLVVPAEEMGPRLAEYARTFGAPPAETKKPAGRDSGYPAIHRILLNQVGHDFSGYKDKTFVRRVRRRMQVLQLAGLDDYVDRLHQDPDQVSLLFRDLLIGVTNFFRDPEAFRLLAKLVMPRLFEGLDQGDTVRIWIPGCATGEEVYSIAILAREHIDTLNAVPRIQLFATDIDEPALGVARAARYPGQLLGNVSEARLQRFFVGDDESYVVTKEIRDMCMFSPHSVIRDPPFSRIDLVSCRNLLIYLGTEFQAHVIPVFHFALKPGGYLFLGTSENVGQHGDLFAPVDKKQRIFQRRDHSVARLQFPLFRTSGRTPGGESELRRDPGGITNLRRAVDARVLDRFAPAHVVVNKEGDILHYSARTGRYLEPAAGLPNRQLLAMARRGLRIELASALREAVTAGQPAVREGLSVEVNDRVHVVGVTVEPLAQDDKDPLFLVLFRDGGPAPSPSEADRQGADKNERSHEHLESELRETRERLQSTIEEYETAVEELKSSNEELQSINEELQSTNEELESSKEELQSVNEELQTVNSELAAKADEADRATSDLQNVFDSTRLPMVFLDRQLVIRSFTPTISAVFNLISVDSGRPLTDIVSNVDFPTSEWPREVQTVIERGQPIERNVGTLDGQTSYIMRILPYRRRNAHIEGVLVTFVDITRLVRAEEQQRTLVAELNHRVRNMLTIVNAIATQTKTQSPSMEAFVEAFTGRIRAMGAAYGTVSRENWGEVSLRDILAGQLQSFMPDNSERIRLSGPVTYFQPAAALAFGMVVHELATNAVKHGALSDPGGQVVVAWKEAEKDGEPCLSLNWTERGGPAAKRPTRQGFGSGLVERELKHALRARYKFEFAANGFSARMFIPLEKDLASIRADGGG